MASIKKRGDGYRVQVVRLVNGQRVYRSATRDTLAEANAWAIETEAELLRLQRGASDPTAASNDGKITLYRAIELYKEERAPDKRGARWEIVRCNKFMRDLPFVGKLVNAVTPEDITLWFRASLKSGKKPNSVNREITLLSTILEFARKEKRWISTNPVSFITRPQESPHRRRLVAPEERKLILAGLRYTEGQPPTRRMHYIALAFLFAIETGARAGEILKLQWEFVNYERKVARVTGGTKNGDYWRDLPLSAEAIRILKLCEQGTLTKKGVTTRAETCFPITSAYLDTVFRRVRDKAGIKDLHFHDTRHQAATNMATKLTPYQLTRVLGHRTLEHVMIYVNEDAAQIADKL